MDTKDSTWADRIAIIMLFILILGAIFLLAWTKEFAIIGVPFVAYGIVALVMHRAWFPLSPVMIPGIPLVGGFFAPFLRKDKREHIENKDYFQVGRKAMIGGWTHLIGGIILIIIGLVFI